MVEADAVLQLELAVDHLEAAVRNRVAVTVADVRVGRGESADRSASVVLDHARIVECDGRGRFVDVADGDGEVLLGREAASVGRGDGDRHIAGLVIEADTILQLELTIDDFKARIGDIVGMTVADVRVSRGERPDCGAGVVLGYARIVECDGGGCFVDVADRNGEVLLGRETAAVGARDGDGDVAGLVVEADALLQLELAADHLEAAVRYRIGMTVADVRVSRGERPDCGAGVVLGYARIVECDGGGCFVDVADRNGEVLLGRETAAVGARDGDGDVAGLVVEADALLQLELAVDHLEAAVRYRIAMTIADVRIACGESANQRTSVVLGNARIVERNGIGCFVHIDAAALLALELL